MGTGADILDILGRLRREGYFASPGRSVAEIGAQQLTNDFLRARAQIADLGALFGVDRPFDLPSPLPSSTGNGGLEMLNREAPLARAFWTWLGFDYAAIDVDGSPGAVPLDLNVDSVPDDMRGRFDLVTNLGTTEHVVNQWNAFRIAHDLAKPGGLMLHNTTCQGFFTHGFVNYTPKFFWYLGRDNGYSCLGIDLLTVADSYELSADVLSGLSVIGDPRFPYRARDVGIRALLRKNIDADFVPPIDVEKGTRTQFPALRQRYGRVFDPEGETRTRTERQVGELQAQLQSAREQLEGSHAQLRTTQSLLEEARWQIEAARASLSWRITAPLRRLTRLFSPTAR